MFYRTSKFLDNSVNTIGGGGGLQAQELRRSPGGIGLSFLHKPVLGQLITTLHSVMEIVNVSTTNCSTGLDVERLKGNSTCSLSNLDSFTLDE